MNKDKFLIIKGKAGMGNRLLSVLNGILYAQITGRKLVIDWSDYTYSNDRSNSFPKYFNKPEIEQLTECYKLSSICPLKWKNNLDKSVNELIDSCEGDRHDRHTNVKVWSKYSLDFKRLDYTEDVLVKWSYFDEVYNLRQHFQGKFAKLKDLSDEQILREILQKMILNHSIQLQVDNFKNNYFSDRVIGLHIRYTDRKNSFKAYPQIIDRLIEKNDCTFFLATDNLLVEKYFKARYKNLFTTEKWHPEQGSPLHQNPKCPDRFENGVQALADIFLLSKCNYLIYDKSSTFGYVAKLISPMPKTNAIDISKLSIQGNMKRFIHWVKTRNVV